MRGVRCQSNELCADPKLIGEPGRFAHEADLDHFNYHLSDSSPAHRAGVRMADIPVDFDGKPRPAEGRYSVGAVE